MEDAITAGESFFLPHLPTPNTSDYKRVDTAAERGRNSPSLVAVSALFPAEKTASDQDTSRPQTDTDPLLPTPAASDYKRNDNPSQTHRKSPGLTTVSAHFPSTLLPTPNARDGVSGGGVDPKVRRAGGHQVTLTDAASTLDIPTADQPQYLPTPKASDGVMGRPRTTGRPIEKSTHLGTIATLLPTPNTMDNLPAREGEARERQLRRGVEGGSKRRFAGNLREDIVYETSGHSYGVYEPAVRRWEELTRTAPAPTEPNKNNKPRLKSEFAEWMMGLPAGWVTDPDIGLTRAQQLKAIGNGVCPQQAAAALQFLLERSGLDPADVPPPAKKQRTRKPRRR